MDEDGKLTDRELEQEIRAVLRKADEAYARFSCPASGECCQLSVTKREPWLWPGEWQLLEARARDDRGGLPEPRPDGGCPFLDASGKRCSVYSDRPFGCRTFFCHRIRGPARQPAEQVDALQRRLAAAHAGRDDAEPHPISWWYARARGGE